MDHAVHVSVLGHAVNTECIYLELLQMLRRPDYSALNQPNTRQNAATKATRLKIGAEGGLPRTGLDWTLAGDTGGPLLLPRSAISHQVSGSRLG